MKQLGAFIVLSYSFFLFSCGGLDNSISLTNWRPCDGIDFEDCDAQAGQVCLPHKWDRDGPSLFRCRDFKSIDDLDEYTALAYCDGQNYMCPSPAVCIKEPVSEPVKYRYSVCGVPAE
ncbi:MAG: hypothetical protein VYC39_19630 [Myxococcota bacterium]|nr:hypothetical protein [Myxococcota bacterium]